MADNYYSTVPSLAWIFGHYFYGRKHWIWLSGEYYPYRLGNPKSSNPHLIYQDIYQPWKDRDGYDKFILQLRLNLHKSVMAQEKAHGITTSRARCLKRICDHIDISFLYPLVYCVDIDIIDHHRRIRAGSALTSGSLEFLVKDLQESEFSIFFLDFDSDSDFSKLVADEIRRGPTTSASTALTILEGRCI